MQERGAFVTLKEHGELRGCIGYSAPIKPLALTVRDVAAYAAVKDNRFRPVSPEELGLLEYEISVLSPLRRVLDVNEIEVGRHGLVVKQGDREGLLLPQVPVEQGWDRATFLEKTCVKAGLLKDCLEGRADRHLLVHRAGIRGARSSTTSAEASDTTLTSRPVRQNPNNGISQALMSTAPTARPRQIESVERARAASFPSRRRCGSPGETESRRGARRGTPAGRTRERWSLGNPIRQAQQRAARWPPGLAARPAAAKPLRGAARASFPRPCPP